MIVYREKNKEEGGKPSSLVIHVYSAVKMWRASLKGSDGRARLASKVPAHNATLVPAPCARKYTSEHRHRLL